jgi:hypothetical protein
MSIAYKLWTTSHPDPARTTEALAMHPAAMGANDETNPI